MKIETLKEIIKKKLSNEQFAILTNLSNGSSEIYNFGIPLALILCTFAICLLFKGWKTVLIKGKDYLDINLYWLTSLSIAFVSHINDISYYDGKVSILIWILLAGVKCQNEEHKFNNESC